MMRNCLVFVAIFAIVSPAGAQLTVSTDQDSYVAGEVVQITIHNGGPSEAMFVSDPFFGIWHVETGTAIFGDVGLPVVTTFPVGTTELYYWDTGVTPDPPGHYQITLYGSSGDPESVLQTTYEVSAPVGLEAVLWGEVKALFRGSPGR
jgi:hypothetical protein